MGVGDVLTTVLGGVFSGGATGLIGLATQKWFDYKKAEQDRLQTKENNEHTRLLHQMDIDAEAKRLTSAELIADRQADMQEAMAITEAEARALDGDVKMRIASMESDKAAYSAPGAQEKSRLVRWLMGFVDAARGLIRPGATAYLLFVTTAMWYQFQEIAERMQVKYTADQVMQINLHLIGSITYCTTTAMVWWFGVRADQSTQTKRL